MSAAMRVPASLALVLLLSLAPSSGRAAPRLTVKPLQLDFVMVDGVAPPAQTVTLRNAGVDPVRVAAVQIGGGSFRLNGLLQPPILLAPNASVDVQVLYLPLDPLPATAQLMVVSDGGDFTVGLSGHVASRVITSPPDQGKLDFGGVVVGDVVVLPLRVMAPGTQALAVTAVKVQVGDPQHPVPSDSFASDVQGPFLVDAGQGRDLRLTFAPPAAGPATARLLVVPHDPGFVTSTVTLTGTAYAPALTITPPAIDFGPVPRLAPAAATVSIDNGAPVSVRLVATVGPPFSVDPVAVRVPASGHSDLVIGFGPPEVTSYAATLHLSRLQGDPVGEVALSGQGTDEVADAAGPQAADAASVVPGASGCGCGAGGLPRSAGGRWLVALLLAPLGRRWGRPRPGPGGRR